MAGTTGAVADFLTNDDHNLEERLKVSLNIFTTDMHTFSSKIAVLEWMKEKLRHDMFPEEQNLIYAVLKRCISSLTEHSLQPQLISKLWEIMQNIEVTSPEIYDCFLALLQNPHFLKYFVFHADELVKIVAKYVEKLNHVEENDVKVSGYRIIVHSISRVNNNALVDHNLKLLFVESLMESLALIYDDLKNNIRGSDYDLLSVETLVYEVLFKNTDFRKAFLRNILAFPSTNDSELDRLAIAIIKKVQEYPTHLRPKILATSYSLLLSGFLHSNFKNEDIFKVFVALNSFIYVRPIYIDENNDKCLLFQENVITVIELTKVMLLQDLPLETEWRFTFSTWLSALIDAVLSKLETEITSQLLNLLKNLLAFNPILVEENVKKLTKSVMLSKKCGQDVVRAHSDFCLYILSVHVKLNRIHKLISAVLITIKENLPSFEIENIPNKFDVFPTEVFNCIQTAVTNLPSTVQNVALLNTLFFHLENDCIVTLERDTSKEVDTRWLLLYDIICFLISCFIRGTRVVDHSVPDVVKTKFISLMESLAALLGRFGKAIISKSHVPELCECFLHLCLVWGDMQMLFMIYETQPRKVPKQVGTAGKASTNLVYLHPYLSDFHWKIIAQRVMNFGGDSCVNLLNDLVLQKINAMPYLEDELQGPYVENVYDDSPSVICAQYLMSNANPKWLFAHVSEFAHLLKPEEVLRLSKILICHCQQCDEKEISTIFSADFRELRPLVVAMLCYTFHSLSKKFASYNLKEMKRMLRRIDYEEMLRAEEQNAEAVQAVREKLAEISSFLSTDFVHIRTDIPGDSFKIDLHILNNLPVRYLRRENKSLACLLTLSLMKNLVRLRFVNYNASDILLQSCKLLHVILTDTFIPECVECGNLLAWFYHGLKETPHCDLILKSICRATQRYGCGVDRVIEIVKAVHHENRTDVFIESKSEGVDLLTSYLVNFEKIRKRKHEQSDVIDKLEKLCYENFDEIFYSSPENDEQGEKQLALFTILLRQALKDNEKMHLKLLLDRLPQYIEMSGKFENTSSDAFSKFTFTLLKHYRTLEAHLPDYFFIDTWSEYFYTLDNDVISVLTRIATKDDYREMMDILLGNTEGSLFEPVDEDLEILSRVWKVIVDTPVKTAKVLMKKKIVREFCMIAQESVISRPANESPSVLKFFLNFFASVMHNKTIPLHYEIIDVCFDLITSITSSRRHELCILTDCVELLFVFCAVREKFLLDRIPSFYLCYKALFEFIVQKCRIEEGNDPVVLATAAHKMEKLTDSLVKNKKDFSKTAISAIADFLGVISTVNVIEAVKNHVKNVIYCWIGICDSHGLQYLSSTLPSASQTLFKQYWADYNKYHKFSGKV